MDLHEYQAKEILSKYGVPLPEGSVAASADEAYRIASEFSGGPIAVKAQVQAGGRGQAGGVRLVDDADAARQAASELLGQTLVTNQTGPRGRVVKNVYIEQAITPEQLVYCAILIDRRSGKIALIGSREGGEDIEERAARDESVIEKKLFDLEATTADLGFRDFAISIGLDGELESRALDLFTSLVKAFLELDASLIEINPLAVTSDGKLIALDTKLSLDDNALFRHPDLAELRDTDELDPVELRAQQHDINFVHLDGNIGLVVNGAGLALATADMLADAGGRPANFMDIRTTATSIQIAQGIDLVLQDPNVRAVLVNIHGGGLTRCDTVAEAIGISMRRTASTIPIVFRAAGTNADFARTVLNNCGVRYIDCNTISQAVTKVVSLVKQAAA